jgi:hypothetical protein
MKMLIFLVALALVAFVVMWRVRQADAEKDLARRKAMKRRQSERQAAVKPEDHVKWPVVVRPAGKGDENPDAALPEPTMTSIEFEPSDSASLRH